MNYTNHTKNLLIMCLLALLIFSATITKAENLPPMGKDMSLLDLALILKADDAPMTAPHKAEDRVLEVGTVTTALAWPGVVLMLTGGSTSDPSTKFLDKILVQSGAEEDWTVPGVKVSRGMAKKDIYPTENRFPNDDGSIAWGLNYSTKVVVRFDENDLVDSFMVCFD